MLVYTTLSALVVLAGVLAAVEPVRRGRGPVALPGLALVAALSVQVWPSSPYSFDFNSANTRNSDRVDTTHRFSTQLGAVRDRIGADSQVLYLAFGDVAYFLGDPTPCRYPSPTFLQRGIALDEVRGLASYQENAACLTDPRMRYLVRAPGWFDLDNLEAPLAQAIRATYDCSAPLRTDDVVVCPRRPS